MQYPIYLQNTLQTLAIYSICRIFDDEIDGVTHKSLQFIAFTANMLAKSIQFKKFINNKASYIMTYYDFKDLKDILIHTIRYANYEDLYIQSKIEKKWNDISGMMLDKAVKIESFKKGVLTLNVVSSTWRSELILRKNRIIKELNNELGNDIVTELIIH